MQRRDIRMVADNATAIVGGRIPYRFEACGYTPIRNPDAEDGYWRVSARRQAIYARDRLSHRERLDAARNRCR